MKNNWKEDFKKSFGIYWSKQGDNAYIADPINNTRPIILSQEAVESYIDSLLAEQKKELLENERQFILNVLDGIDIADKEVGVIGGTQAIRQALQSRVI